MNTITLELEKEDLVNLINGFSPPSYQFMENIKSMKLGSYTGGFTGRWDWDKRALRNLSEIELYDFYLLCKKAK